MSPNSYMNGVDLKRAGLNFLALMVFAFAGVKLIQQGEIVLGRYTAMMFIAAAIVGGLIWWDSKTKGSQAWIVILATVAFAVYGTNVYQSLDAAGEQEFIGSLRAAGLIVLGVIVSVMLHHHTQPAPVAPSAEISVDDTPAQESVATTL